jgi:hypothetical protein
MPLGKELKSFVRALQKLPYCRLSATFPPQKKYGSLHALRSLKKFKNPYIYAPFGSKNSFKKRVKKPVCAF